MPQGEMERSQGGDGAFSGLAGGDDDDPGIVAAQDFGLFGVRDEAEVFLRPFDGVGTHFGCKVWNDRWFIDESNLWNSTLLRTSHG